jgi:hypothetical protein
MAAAATAVLAVVYFSLAASLLYETPDPTCPTVVGGFSYGILENVWKLMEKEHISASELLKGMEYKVESVWTKRSLDIAKVLLLSTWVSLFLSVSAALSALILAIEAKQAKGRSNVKGGPAKPT